MWACEAEAIWVWGMLLYPGGRSVSLCISRVY